MHRERISDHIFDILTHLGQIISFDPFWGTLEVKKGKKLSISLKSPPPPLEAAINHKFWTIFGGTIGVKWVSKKVKNCLSR